MIISNTVLWLRVGRMVSSDLATYKSPLAIVALLLYQQSSSTISPYSYTKATLLVNGCFPLLTFFCYHTFLCPSLYYHFLKTVCA